MPIKREKKIIIFTAVLIFALKFLLALYFSANKAIDLGDQSAFRYWTELLIRSGLDKFYSQAQFFPYPPLANYLFFFIGKICSGIGVSLESPVFNLFIRLPGILGDIGTAILLYALCRKITDFRLSYGLFVFYLFQPAAIFISSVWGQPDGFMTLFLVLAFYLIVNKKINLGLVSLLFAFLLKPQALPLVIPMGFIALAVGGIKRFIMAILLVAILFFALFYPFYPHDPFLGPFYYFSETQQDFSPRFTASAFNFWYFFYGGWQDNFPVLLGFSVRLWSRILFILSLVVGTFFGCRSKSVSGKSLAVGLSGFAFFLFFTQIKERYLFAALPFFCLAVFLHRNRIAIILTVVLSLLFSINTMGFFVGWVNFGLWNSTFLSWGSLDKITAALFILLFCYYLSLLKKSENNI
ncbi:hypothetical protein HZA75_06615 [Candidatus Roizmanbacteria bacterium]|nr:hypothetical protein [Candidatus Roizmanbacteria bacterium]